MSAIAIKRGVRVRGISGEIMIALWVAYSIFDKAQEDLTITSITDGDHMPGSKHHTGDAVDLRLPKVVHPDNIVGALRTALGADYDVVLEQDHIHVEYDPS